MEIREATGHDGEKKKGQEKINLILNKIFFSPYFPSSVNNTNICVETKKRNELQPANANMKMKGQFFFSFLILILF